MRGGSTTSSLSTPWCRRPPLRPDIGTAGRRFPCGQPSRRLTGASSRLRRSLRRRFHSDSGCELRRAAAGRGRRPIRLRSLPGGDRARRIAKRQIVLPRPIDRRKRIGQPGQSQAGRPRIEQHRRRRQGDHRHGTGQGPAGRPPRPARRRNPASRRRRWSRQSPPSERRRAGFPVVRRRFEEFDRAGQPIAQGGKVALDLLGDRHVVQPPGQHRPQIANGGPNPRGQHRQQRQNADAGIAKMDPIVGQAQDQSRRPPAPPRPSSGRRRAATAEPGGGPWRFGFRFRAASPNSSRAASGETDPRLAAAPCETAAGINVIITFPCVYAGSIPP